MSELSPPKSALNKKVHPQRRNGKAFAENITETARHFNPEDPLDAQLHPQLSDTAKKLKSSTMHTEVYHEPQRVARKPRPKIKSMIIPVFSVVTGAMVGLAASQLVGVDGVGDMVKVGLLTVGATLVSAVVNHYAIEEGAELAATGFTTAGIVSVGSILIVGGGLFSSTYAGLTLAKVNKLKLQEHVAHLSQYVATENTLASQTLRAKPVIDSASSDIKAHISCEQRTGCLSGKAGAGTVTRAIEPLSGRADNISKQLEDGNAARADQLARINALIGDYQSILGNGDLSQQELFQKLSRIHATIMQKVSSLKEALPLSLLKAYSAELENGLEISKRPMATQNVNRLLRKHGANLKSVLASLEDKAVQAPQFPSKAGVSSTFAYIGSFLPIAALAFTIELVMPLTMWIYMFLSIVWRKYKIEHPASSKGSADNAV